MKSARLDRQRTQPRWAELELLVKQHVVIIGSGRRSRRGQRSLLQQGTLPSTGATTTSNYYNVLLNQQFQFSPAWLGSLTIEASGFHHTKARSATLGEGFDFPFTANFLTTSGLET